MNSFSKLQAGRAIVRSVDEIISVGVTVPLGGTLMDGTEVVIKYPNNPFGNQVLINEIIGAFIGEMIGIRLPEYGVCNLTAEVIRFSDCYGAYGEGIDESNAGTCFYTKRYINSTEVRAYARNAAGKEGVLIVLYDYILNNYDRHKGNLLQLIGTDQLLCIDNSHIIIQPGDVIANIQKYSKEKYICSMGFFDQNKELYQSLLSDIELCQMEEIASEVQEKITAQLLHTAERFIPIEWKKSVDENMIETMMNIIYARSCAVVKVCRSLWEFANE